jgi:hypothetical protein
MAGVYSIKEGNLRDEQQTRGDGPEYGGRGAGERRGATFDCVWLHDSCRSDRPTRPTLACGTVPPVSRWEPCAWWLSPILCTSG